MLKANIRDQNRNFVDGLAASKLMVADLSQWEFEVHELTEAHGIFGRPFG